MPCSVAVVGLKPAPTISDTLSKFKRHKLSTFSFFLMPLLLFTLSVLLLFLPPSLLCILFVSRSNSPLSRVPCVDSSVQMVQITSVMRTPSFHARQTTAASLSGPAVTAPMTALITATSKAAVSVVRQHVCCDMKTGLYQRSLPDHRSSHLSILLFLTLFSNRGCDL